jgi:hypothetical protein
MFALPTFTVRVRATVGAMIRNVTPWVQRGLLADGVGGAARAVDPAAITMADAASAMLSARKRGDGILVLLDRGRRANACTLHADNVVAAAAPNAVFATNGTRGSADQKCPPIFGPKRSDRGVTQRKQGFLSRHPS